MDSQKRFKENLETVSAIKDITSIYQEIASLRTSELKEGVRKLKKFLEGVSEIYNHAKGAYIGGVQKQLLTNRKNLQDLSFIKRNGRTILVFLSANEHLYGNLILDVWNEFLADSRSTKNDFVVVGTFGRYLVKTERLAGSTVYFDLDDDKPKQEQIQKIIDHISRYERIIVYFGQVVSILNQTAAKAEISGGTNFEQKVEGYKKYLFEPAPEKILEFFETEIIAALFRQKIYEHQLARFAARIFAMSQANENAYGMVEKISADLTSLKRRLHNRKQMEIFSASAFLYEKDAVK